MKIVSLSPSEKSQKILESLTRAVAQELEKKRRLGHYAVISKDGKPTFIGEDKPCQYSPASIDTTTTD